MSIFTKRPRPAEMMLDEASIVAVLHTSGWTKLKQLKQISMQNLIQHTKWFKSYEHLY